MKTNVKIINKNNKKLEIIDNEWICGIHKIFLTDEELLNVVQSWARCFLQYPE